MCFILHVLYMSICYLVSVCVRTGVCVCDSPWNGRPPPQRLRLWSTGYALRAWPPGSRRSDCTESQPSAGAPGIHRPPGPQAGLTEDKHGLRNPLVHARKCEPTLVAISCRQLCRLHAAAHKYNSAIHKCDFHTKKGIPFPLFFFNIFIQKSCPYFF